MIVMLEKNNNNKGHNINSWEYLRMLIMKTTWFSSVGDQLVRTSGFNILHVDPGMDYCGFVEVRPRDS